MEEIKRQIICIEERGCSKPQITAQAPLVDAGMLHMLEEFIYWHTQLKYNIVLYKNVVFTWKLASNPKSGHVTKTTKMGEDEKHGAQRKREEAEGK